eukprot:220128-Rhodomonas_salina.1
MSSCESVPQSLGAGLFTQWLSDGNLLYEPPRKRYVWLPSSTVSFSALPHILPVNLSLSDGTFSVGLHDPERVLNGGAVTGRVLGAAYWSDIALGGGGGAYRPLLNSAVGHWRTASSAAFRRRLTGQSLWYAAATEVAVRSWLHDIRYDATFLTLRAFASTQHVVDVEVERYCDGQTCTGCSTLRLRQLCSALQTCMLTNFVGSVVNEGNLLCSGGLLLESLYSQTLGLYIAAWHALVSILVAGVESRSHASVAHAFRAEWASDVVYTLLCELKDVHAAATGIVATVIHRGGSSLQPGTGSFDMQRGRAVNREAYGADAMFVAALHQLMYQTSLFPLYLGFGLHRWGVCSVTDVVEIATDGRLHIGLGEQGPGKGPEQTRAWAVCSNAATVEEILHASNTEGALGRMTDIINDVLVDDVSVENMKNGVLPFSPLDLLLHLFDAGVAWAIGVITGMQDVLYNVDDAECQVSDIAVSDAVQCACGDDPAAVVPLRRAETFAQGAFWCSGVLYVALDDGTFGYVFNPYSLEELGRRVEPTMDKYLQCLSAAGEPGEVCVEPIIQAFAEVGVSALTVLTRCRANYAQRQWDMGAGMLFAESFVPPAAHLASLVSAARAKALHWAVSMGADVEDCVKRTAGTNEFQVVAVADTCLMMC